jgi:hypothetical protein
MYEDMLETGYKIMDHALELKLHAMDQCARRLAKGKTDYKVESYDYQEI